MANFYLRPFSDDGVLYELHATTDVSVSFKSSITSYPIETGFDVSDNVVIAPTQVSFSGILTDVKRYSESNVSLEKQANSEYKGLQNYIEELRKRQENRELFFVYFSGQGASELEGIDKAILTDFSINKNPSLGTSWEVSLTLQQVRLATLAKTVAEPATNYKEILSSKSDDVANTNDPKDSSKPAILEGNILAVERANGTSKVRRL